MTYQAATPPSPDAVGEYVAVNADRGNMLVRRWAGCWIDLLFLAVLVILVFVLAAAILPREEGAGIALLLAALVVLGYFPLTEGLWGRSLGKFVTGTIVIQRDGSRASFGQVVGRTILRLVEVNPLLAGGIPAGIALLCTKGKQRLGDLAAGTYVVPVKALQAARAQESVF